MPIRVILADDHPIFVESLSMLLETIEGIEVVGTAQNGIEVLEKIAIEKVVDILICDYMMPKMDGVQLAFQLKKSYPSIKILMLTSREDAEGIRNAIQAGVKGFISKKTNKTELEKALFALSNGLTFYPTHIIQALTSTSSEIPSEKSSNTQSLSNREIEVLKLIAQGLSGVQIAEKLNLSHHTIETHRKTLFRKIGVNSTYALIKYAMQNGLNT